MTNHKVKNATPLEYNNIQFKSRLEVMIYKTLLQEGFSVQYEHTKYGKDLSLMFLFIIKIKRQEC